MKPERGVHGRADSAKSTLHWRLTRTGIWKDSVGGRKEGPAAILLHPFETVLPPHTNWLHLLQASCLEEFPIPARFFAHHGVQPKPVSPKGLHSKPWIVKRWQISSFVSWHAAGLKRVRGQRNILCSREREVEKTRIIVQPFFFLPCGLLNWVEKLGNNDGATVGFYWNFSRCSIFWMLARDLAPEMNLKGQAYVFVRLNSLSKNERRKSQSRIHLSEKKKKHWKNVELLSRESIL